MCVEERLREEIKRSIGLKMSRDEFISYVRKNVLRNPSLKPVIGAKGKGVVVMKDILEVVHPVLKKLVDYGNMSRKINRETSDLLAEISRLVTSDDPAELVRLNEVAQDFLDRVEEVAIGYIATKVLESGDDLRPTMMPGSVGRGEAPNLYLAGENYREEDRGVLALQLASSVAIGKSVSVYFEGDFHDYLRELVRAKFDRPYLEAGDVRASGWEVGEPFVALLRLLLWVYEEISGEDGDRSEELVEMMRSSSGTVYFTPGMDREKFTAFSFPQLDAFVVRWLKEGERRRAVRSMLDSVKLTCSMAYRRGREAAGGQIQLIHQHLNLVASTLIGRAVIMWEPLRKIVDGLIELAARHEVPVNLYFVDLLSG